MKTHFQLQAAKKFSNTLFKIHLLFCNLLMLSKWEANHGLKKMPVTRKGQRHGKNKGKIQVKKKKGTKHMNDASLLFVA